MLHKHIPATESKFVSLIRYALNCSLLCVQKIFVLSVCISCTNLKWVCLKYNESVIAGGIMNYSYNITLLINIKHFSALLIKLT